MFQSGKVANPQTQSSNPFVESTNPFETESEEEMSSSEESKVLYDKLFKFKLANWLAFIGFHLICIKNNDVSQMSKLIKNYWYCTH